MHHQPQYQSHTQTNRNKLPQLRFVDRFETEDNIIYAEEIESRINLWRVTGEVDTARGILTHDAVIYNDSIVRPEYTERFKTVDLYHDYAGRKASLKVDRVLDNPVITLEEAKRI